MMRVVIEPGHGGKDPGAVGPNGLCERDVITEVSHFLASKGGDGIEYILKRRTAFPSLAALFAWMSRFKPDVILSLHCDSAAATHASAIVWCYDPDKDRYCRSALLADTILAGLCSHIGGPTRVLTAPYLRRRPDGSTYMLLPGVLRGRALRASVLVELGPMHPRMAEVEWQSRAACGVDAGLRRWVKQEEV